MAKKPIQETEILKVLQTVKDPEITSVSIIDLGMIEKVEINQPQLRIYLLPTFLGCPALEIIKGNVINALACFNEFTEIQVEFLLHPPWTSDRISEDGRRQLLEFGIAPPPTFITETGEWTVNCPYCSSPYTTLENLFGPTACRSILYCKSCKNPFEAMKPMANM
ncbi:1,2-phenylacetyl-CoA epoxidase subunit PaaD [Bacillus sp. CGMCC 1.16607]|uniref:1,2-phenylacetyl-CoA epoxidase subunit PaaD n=1 Tax=Bacillus sp. CGMCC 1.16607 TaxID=3351842 RepID=UPI00362625A0